MGREQHGEGEAMAIYVIRVLGRLDQRWSAHFGGLTIGYEGDDITVLHGLLIDETALHGVLSKVREPFAAAAQCEPGARQQEV
jgi:hypothetical protein